MSHLIGAPPAIGAQDATGFRRKRAQGTPPNRSRDNRGRRSPRPPERYDPGSNHRRVTLDARRSRTCTCRGHSSAGTRFAQGCRMTRTRGSESESAHPAQQVGVAHASIASRGRAEPVSTPARAAIALDRSQLASRAFANWYQNYRAPIGTQDHVAARTWPPNSSHDP